MKTDDPRLEKARKEMFELSTVFMSVRACMSRSPVRRVRADGGLRRTQPTFRASKLNGARAPTLGRTPARIVGRLASSQLGKKLPPPQSLLVASCIAGDEAVLGLRPIITQLLPHC